MKHFKINVINEKIKLAAIDAERLLDRNSTMMLEILAKDDFKYNSGMGYQVFNKIVAFDKVLPIFTYRSKWPFSKALGYFDGKAIYINLRKLDSLDHSDLVGLLCHEYSHAVGFSHGSNYPSEDKNKFSVPYFISENIGRWL